MNFDKHAPLQPFKPMRLLTNPHAQMIAGHFSNRWKPKSDSKLLIAPLRDGDKLIILADIPRDRPRAVAMLLHGLGGHAGAKYMLSASRRLTENGYVVLRVNLRGAGEGAGLVRKTYHAGLSEDVHSALTSVLAQFPSLRFVLVGFSMSGNTVLKYAGERGTETSDRLAGVVAINPAVDLERCINAISKPYNRVYHRRYVKLLLKQLASNQKRIELKATSDALDTIDSIYTYDNLVTADLWGFPNADAYYRHESAVMSIPNIAVPTVVLTSDDDPIIPVQIFSDVRWPDNTRLHVAQGGGHMGYLASRKTPLGDHRWLDYYLIHAAELLIQ